MKGSERELKSDVQDSFLLWKSRLLVFIYRLVAVVYHELGE